MECFESDLSWEKTEMENCLAFLPGDAGSICFFDIETTGLSPEISSVYLIGAAVWDRCRFRLVQWFADDYISEKELLSAFASYAAPCSTFAHYNGASFDVPYLEKKYATYKLPSPFEGKESIDLFRGLPKNKQFFHTRNRKLQTMEKLLSFQRSDTFSGKDCIGLYTDFMQKKFFRDARSEERKKQLLLHNHDDLQGTVLCAQLLSYQCGNLGIKTTDRSLREPSLCPISHPTLREPSPTIFSSEGTYANVCGKLPRGYFPLSVSEEIPLSRDGAEPPAVCHFGHDSISLKLPLLEGVLYHYFSDYKNYYYLPKEDMAIHKSVGAYVDKKYREQACAANCYTKKEGRFLPVFPEMEIPPELVFRTGSRSRKIYIESGSFPDITERQWGIFLQTFLSKADHPSCHLF